MNINLEHVYCTIKNEFKKSFSKRGVNNGNYI
ncbi:hypothetical protein BD780_001701 [Clostridium tetanomorphum]|nr:hypothetical protein [Clostridium tetanomorphum]NRS84476.1 hypothetical protein [Clostridium tetanomorphum]NRZ97690.1 hypothetical protein [Clostridium tetanomorphum]SQB92028.1 Uncharacterised protein [Clostridium tetanomorphum]